MGKERLVVFEEIISCKSCPLSEASDPVPFCGPTPADIVIMGDNPGLVEQREGSLFAGPAGDLIKKHLREVGIDPTTVGMMNVISCFSSDTPTSSEVEACGSNRNSQFELFAPKWVILLGQVALRAIRPDLHISHSRGAPFLHEDYKGVTFFPIYHPAYALRQVSGDRQVRHDLEVFAKMRSEGHPIKSTYMSDHCSMCGIDAIYWEESMVAWGRCARASCGLPESSKNRVAPILEETDHLPCRKTGCSSPATSHPLSFPTGTAPEQMSWAALSGEQQIIMQMIFTGGEAGISLEAMLSQRKKKKSGGGLLSADLDVLDALGWAIPPSDYRETWVLSPRGRKEMEKI